MLRLCRGNVDNCLGIRATALECHSRLFLVGATLETQQAFITGKQECTATFHGDGTLDGACRTLPSIGQFNSCTISNGQGTGAGGLNGCVVSSRSALITHDNSTGIIQDEVSTGGQSPRRPGGSGQGSAERQRAVVSQLQTGNGSLHTTDGDGVGFGVVALYRTDLQIYISGAIFTNFQCTDDQ